MTFDDFCAAFLIMADAHSVNVTQPSEGALEQVRSAGADLLAVGEGLPMTDAVRAGFVAFVADVTRESASATPEEQAAFSGFLTVACPP